MLDQFVFGLQLSCLSLVLFLVSSWLQGTASESQHKGSNASAEWVQSRTGVITGMSRASMPLYIGCIYHNESTLTWLSWYFVCCVVSWHDTWMILFVSPTCPVVANFTCHHHINCLFDHSGSQPSVDAHFQLLHHSSRTHYPLPSRASDIQSSPFLPIFCQRLQTFLFRQSFPNIVLWLYCAFVDFIVVLLF